MSMIMKLAQEVVSEYAAVIAEDLGITHDGILDRIVVSDKLVLEGEDVVRGVCEAGCYTYGFNQVVYKKGTARIELYPYTFITYFTKKNEPKRMSGLFYFFFKKKLKKELLLVLAHEMRHAWQYTTGEIFKHKFMGKHSYLPYKYCWEEKDANEYADKFIKSKGVK